MNLRSIKHTPTHVYTHALRANRPHCKRQLRPPPIIQSTSSRAGGNRSYPRGLMLLTNGPCWHRSLECHSTPLQQRRAVVVAAQRADIVVVVSAYGGGERLVARARVSSARRRRRSDQYGGGATAAPAPHESISVATPCMLCTRRVWVPGASGRGAAARAPADAPIFGRT